MDLFLDILVNLVDKVDYAVRSYNQRFIIPANVLDIDDWWIKHLPQPPSTLHTIVAAIDGGGRFTDLAGGGALYIARAISVFSDGRNPIRMLEVEVAETRSRKYMDVLRSLIEFKTALKTVENMPKKSILLIDGSYYVNILKCLIRIAKLLRKASRLKASEERLLLKTIELLNTIAKLNKEAYSKDIIIGYVSKDSNLNVLKEYILATSICKLDSKLCSLITKTRLDKVVYDRILSLTGKQDNDLKMKLLKILLDKDIHDVNIISAITDSLIGFSKPIIPTINSKLISLLPLLIKDQVNMMNEAEDQVNILNLTLPMLSYVKLNPTDQPIMVEALHKDLHFNLTNTSSNMLVEADEAFIDLLRVIVKGYVNYKYYNIWLVKAHEYSHMSRRTFRYYLNYLDSMLRTRNLRIPVTRRYSLGGIH